MTEILLIDDPRSGLVSKEYDSVKINSAGQFVCTPSESSVEPKESPGLDGPVEHDTADVYPAQRVVQASINSASKAYGLNEY